MDKITNESATTTKNATNAHKDSQKTEKTVDEKSTKNGDNNTKSTDKQF